MMCASTIAREFMKKGRSDACPVIDVHGHYGPYSGIYLPDAEGDRMVETMDRCGVRYIIASSHDALVDPERGNPAMQEVIRTYAGRIYGYWVINPNYLDDPAREMALFEKASGFLGFKFLSDYHRYPITGERYAPVLEYANARSIPILMHTWGNSPYDSPHHVREVASRWPRVPILMGHSGYGEWDAAIAIAREYDRVYLELTAAYAVAGVIERMVEGAGSEKVLFGTDLPWFDPHYGIGCVVFAGISEEDRKNTLHGNAATLFGERP